jgi:protein ImuA
MQLISCHNHQLLKLNASDLTSARANNNPITTHLSPLDALLPNHSLARAALHELLWTTAQPLLFAALLAQSATRSTGVPPVKKKNNLPPIIWSDPQNQLYPPALAAAGIPLHQLYLLKPQSPQDELWALTQCLACKGVGATVANVGHLTRIQARRLQLAAERGGGVGLLLRPHDPKISKEHAAATRWLIEPAPGERTVQRWKIQLIHGHGGLTHKPVYLEYHRDRDPTDRLRATDQLADRQSHPPAAKRARA